MRELIILVDSYPICISHTHGQRIHFAKCKNYVKNYNTHWLGISLLNYTVIFLLQKKRYSKYLLNKNIKYRFKTYAVKKKFVFKICCNYWISSQSLCRISLRDYDKCLDQQFPSHPSLDHTLSCKVCNIWLESLSLILACIDLWYNF